MKNSLVLILMVLFTSIGYTQKMDFFVARSENQAVTKQTLHKAEQLIDIYPNYPDSWIRTYHSVTITAINNGEPITVKSEDNALTREQKEILKKADSGTDVKTVVTYNPNNSLNDLEDVKSMNFTSTVMPYHEAKFDGGLISLEQYLKESIIDVFAVNEDLELRDSEVVFVIDKSGNPVDVRVSAIPHNEKSVTVIKEAICNMPKWKPAQDDDGTKMRQEFFFKAGLSNYSCMRAMKIGRYLLNFEG